MEEARRLTTLWASTARYRDSFIARIPTKYISEALVTVTGNLGPPSNEWNLRVKQTGYNDFLLVPDVESDFVLGPLQGHVCLFLNFVLLYETDTTWNVNH
jgi:hypothetical protein